MNKFCLYFVALVFLLSCKSVSTHSTDSNLFDTPTSGIESKLISAIESAQVSGEVEVEGEPYQTIDGATTDKFAEFSPAGGPIGKLATTSQGLGSTPEVAFMKAREALFSRYLIVYKYLVYNPNMVDKYGDRVADIAADIVNFEATKTSPGEVTSVYEYLVTRKATVATYSTVRLTSPDLLPEPVLRRIMAELGLPTTDIPKDANARAELVGEYMVKSQRSPVSPEAFRSKAITNVGIIAQKTSGPRPLEISGAIEPAPVDAYAQLSRPEFEALLKAHSVDVSAGLERSLINVLDRIVDVNRAASNLEFDDRNRGEDTSKERSRLEEQAKELTRIEREFGRQLRESARVVEIRERFRGAYYSPPVIRK